MSVAETIDLSRMPLPAAIEPLDYEAMQAQFVARFVAVWDAVRAANPDFPLYDVDGLETDPIVIASQAFSYVRVGDRSRVNDVVKALLAPLSTGTDLDNVVASANVERLVITPATGSEPAVMESDAAMLRRYLLSFDRPSAGSADRYRYEAYTAVPTLHDVAVIGWAIHRRRGDTDIVIAGPNGAPPSTGQVLAVYNACNASDVKPEAVAVQVVPAVVSTYTVSLKIEVPKGPDPAIVAAEARAAVLKTAAARLRIGGEVPAEALSAAAFNVPNVLRVTRLSPSDDILANPYRIPVCGGVSIDVEVRA